MWKTREQTVIGKVTIYNIKGIVVKSSNFLGQSKIIDTKISLENTCPFRYFASDLNLLGDDGLDIFRYF